MDAEQDTRWQREAAFFDRKAAETAPSSLVVPPDTLARYRQPNLAYFSADYRIAGLGPLAGSTVLDVGCGDGASAVLLALLGAQVTGIDVSPGAIAVARQRAAANGVADRCVFRTSPIEEASFADASFDAIWCYAFLHHVIADLPSVLTRLDAWLAPGGRVMIAEPVNLSSRFRAARLALLPAPDATPDERPLERTELALIARTFDTREFRHFGLLTRAAKYALPDQDYEHAAPWRRAIYRTAARTDAVLLRSGASALASQIVVHARKR